MDLLAFLSLKELLDIEYTHFTNLTNFEDLEYLMY